MELQARLQAYHLQNMFLNNEIVQRSELRRQEEVIARNNQERV
jgi:hypothetical protein